MKINLLEGVSHIVYHGTDKDFDRFDVGRVGERRYLFHIRDVKSSGIFFSPSMEDAKKYGDTIIKVRIDVKNTLVNPRYVVSGERDSKLWDDIDYIFGETIDRDGGVHYDGGLRIVDRDDDYRWLEYAFGDNLLDWYYLDDVGFVKRMLERGL